MVTRAGGSDQPRTSISARLPRVKPSSVLAFSLVAAFAAACSSSSSSPTPPAAAADAGPTGGGSDAAAGADASADTWAGWAQGFAATYCVECHGAGDTTRDYTKLDDVVRDHAEIRCGVATTKLSGCGSFPPPKQFPITNASGTNPKPTDADRLRFVAWIEAGLAP
jgi:hypothetical protein